MTHPWPRMEIINMQSYFDEWELYGIREWAYRAKVHNDSVAHFVAHRLTSHGAISGVPITAIYDPVYGQDFHFEHYPVHATFDWRFLKPPLGYRFADGNTYYNHELTPWQGLWWDNRLIAARSGGGFRLRFSIDNGEHCPDEQIQEGAQTIHTFFTNAPWTHIRGDENFVRYLKRTVEPWLKKQELHSGTILEEKRVDTSIRDSKVVMFPFERFPKLAEYLSTVTSRYREELTPYVSGFNNPDIQYTVYEDSAGHFYNWHKDGSIGSSMDYRKLSMTLVLENAEEGGIFELAGVGPIHCEPGDIILFPSWMEHRVTPVTKGTRRSLVAWFEDSHIDIDLEQTSE